MTDFTAQPVQGANTTTAGDQFGPQVAHLAGGGFVTIWTSGTGDQAAVYSQVFDASGAKVGAETRLFFDPSVTGDGYLAGGVVGLADGSFVVSATSEHPDPTGVNPPTWTVYAQRVSSLGEPAGEPVVVTAEPAFARGFIPTAGAVHAAPDGGFYVEMDRFYKPTPLSTFETVLQRYDANGTAIGAAFSVGSGDVTYPQVAVLENGTVASVWTGIRAFGLGLTWQLTTAGGELIAQETIQASAGTLESAPAIAALENGNFITVWHHVPSTLPDAPADPVPTGWVGQLRDAAGQPIGSPFAMAIPQDGSGVRLTSMPDGGFLAWWSDDSGIVGRDFDASGQPAGDVFAIGSTVTDIAASSDGGFWVALQLANAGTGQDVYVQKFDDVVPAPGGTIVGGNGKDELHGSASNDVLLGGNGKDLLFGDLGDDTLDGGNGPDTAVYVGNRAEYTVTQTSTGFTVSGPEGTDTLTDVERLQFGDTRIALDVHGNGGMAFRLYQAGFDRTPDLPGLGYQMTALDDGLALSQVAAHFLASPEFQARYGALDDAQFITQLYANVLNRAADEGGMQHHLDEIAQGHTRADMLTHFSESPENQAAVIGSIQGGMVYTLA